MPLLAKLLAPVAALGLIVVAPPLPAPAATPPAAAEVLAATPPMGFNNWNAFGCSVSAELIQQTADLFVSTGLKDAGYEYVNIDDCWSLKERGADGRLVPDPAKFPDGIAAVADYVHSRGLKLGIYGDAGTRTCAGYPGSLGHEDVDARTWAEWGVDYLKYDNCNNQSDGSQAEYIARYTAMRQALDRTGRTIVYSICEWGTSRPWEWAPGVGQLWRTTGDISDNWPSVRSIIAQNAPLYPYAGPGHWNDPDMLEIGNGGMTATEYRTHMSMWAMMAAPLIIGTDLREASADTLAILGNRDVIAIDQDPLGVQAAVVSDRDGLMVLDKPLAGGERAIALYNATDVPAVVSTPAAATGLGTAAAYRLRDVWTGDVTQARATISASVPAHGAVVYRVRPLSTPAGVAPSVTVGVDIGTVVPGPGDPATLTTVVTNRGAGALQRPRVRVRAPEGWTVEAATPARAPALRTDAALATTWTVRAPASTSAGRYPLEVTASYAWGARRTPASVSTGLVATVVTAPADGNRHLSTVEPASVTNALGPMERDQSNGTAAPGDGALITIAGRHYPRGLGTTTDSTVVYYLGGRCTRLVADVGVDDEAGPTGAATFTVTADDTVVASAGPMRAGDAAKPLTAGLAGATWLGLSVTGDAAVHADWAAPVLTCGDADPAGPVLPAERTLFSFETGTEDWTVANPETGGTVQQTAAFHTEGAYGLQVSAPAAGNWFGRVLPAPVDLAAMSELKVDVRAGVAGTTGEIAVQIGPELTWCQGGRWAWTNAGSSSTVEERFDQIECPLGVTFDPADIRAVWVFLNGSDAAVDNLRAG